MKKISFYLCCIIIVCSCQNPGTEYYGENSEKCLEKVPVELKLASGSRVEAEACLCEDSILMLEGDIELHASIAGKQTGILGNVTMGEIWDGGTVPYELSGNLPAGIRKNVNDAIAHWQEKTRIRFVPRNQETDYILFTKGSSPTIGSSMVGKAGGRQLIHLGSATGLRVAIHEIGHALGLFHEQSRKDRDQYVTIAWENITSGNQYNFDKKGDTSGPYDFNSRMHYDPYAFARDRRKPTIIPKDPANVIRNDGWLSAGDIRAINRLYNFR